MLLRFKDNSEIAIRKYTREYAANQKEKVRLNITADYTSADIFDSVVAKARKEGNSSHLEIAEDNSTTVFDGYIIENILEIHDGMSNDILIRAYLPDESSVEA